MPTYTSRARPWPWDVRMWATPMETPPASFSVVPSTGMMLLPQQGSILIGKKQSILDNVVPVDQAYDAAPIYKERTYVFKPTGGYGEREQTSTTDRRYHYALDCWIVGGFFGKGPYIHPLVPPTTGPIRQFIDGLNAARTLALFALAGPNVLQSTNDINSGQTVAYTRAGQIAQSAVRFQSLGTTPVDAIYVAWDDGVLTQMGATNVTCTLPSGMHANYVEKIGRELWIADAVGSTVRSCNNDPTAAGSWSGPIQIGDTSVPITCLRAAGGRLWIVKSNGDVFSLNTDGSDNDWFPSQNDVTDPTNGRTAASWMGALWFRAGPTFYRMDPTPTLSPVGPERLMTNASEVMGPVQAFAGWGAHLAFCGIYNTNAASTSTNQPTSYLLTYGNWEPAVQESPTGPSLQFVDQYDGAIAHWPNRQITALYVTAAKPNPRLYVGFADGGYDWFKLVQNPLSLGSGAEYTTGASRLIAPLHTAMFEANLKEWVGASGFGPWITTADNAIVNYRLRGSAGSLGGQTDMSWHALNPPITNNGMRIDFPPKLAAISAEFAVDLYNASMNDTPIFEGLGFHERVVPDFRYDWSLTIDASDYIARKDGASVRQSGRRIRDVLVQIAGAPQLATVELPDETIESLALVNYTERLVPHYGQGGQLMIGGPRFGQQWAIDVQLTQFSTITTIGIIGRLRGNTIGSLRGYKISDLRTM